MRNLSIFQITVVTNPEFARLFNTAKGHSGRWRPWSLFFFKGFLWKKKIKKIFKAIYLRRRRASLINNLHFISRLDSVAALLFKRYVIEIKFFLFWSFVWDPSLCGCALATRSSPSLFFFFENRSRGKGAHALASPQEIWKQRGYPDL